MSGWPPIHIVFYFYRLYFLHIFIIGEIYEEVQRKKRCRICGQSAAIYLRHEGSTYFICAYCNDRFFNDMFSFEGKHERLTKAMEIASLHKISLGLALNVACGRYSLDEAKRRNRLDKRQHEGGSNDIYLLGKRLLGSFK